MKAEEITFRKTFYPDKRLCHLAGISHTTLLWGWLHGTEYQFSIIWHYLPTPPPHIFHFWHYSRPFATIRDYSPLFAIVHHYSRPFATIRDYPLFVIHVFQLPRCILESVKILFVLLQFYHITAELRSLRGGTRWTVRPQCILAYSFRKLTSALVCTIIRYSVATSCIT